MILYYIVAITYTIIVHSVHFINCFRIKKKNTYYTLPKCIISVEQDNTKVIFLKYSVYFENVDKNH